MPANRLGESLATYLYDEMDTLCDLESQVDSLPDNGNVAFNRVKPQALLGILLAAHDEPTQHVTNLLLKIEQRIHDDDMPPTSLIVSCNAPQGQQNTAQYRANLSAIKDFQSQVNSRSDLAVSFYEIAYPENTTQGRRRRDWGNAAKMHSWRLYSPNKFPDKMSLMMLDVDTEDITPGAFTQMHQLVMRGQPVVTAAVKHAIDPAYPRLAKALRFTDMLYSTLPEGGWDGYMMFDLATLADKGSYPANVNTGEVQAIAQACTERLMPARNAVFTTSSRRLHAQYLAGKLLFHQCWPSFSATEDYRLRPPDKDISEEQLGKIGLANINFSIAYNFELLKEYGQQVRKQPPSIAFSDALRQVADQVKRANHELQMGLENTEPYQAVQEAAKKYCIV